MNKDRRANQILHWFPEGRKRRGRPRKNYTDTVKNDLRGLEISLERAEELAMDRVERRRCVADLQDGLRSKVRILWPTCVQYNFSSHDMSLHQIHKIMDDCAERKQTRAHTGSEWFTDWFSYMFSNCRPNYPNDLALIAYK